MPHITYPTPANAALDIGHNHRHEFLQKDNLQVIGGKELLELQAIARYWADHHAAGTHRKEWLPVYNRITKEVMRRLEAGKVDGYIRLGKGGKTITSAHAKKLEKSK